MDNNFFINQLVEEGARKSLPHPVKQTALWLAGTAVYLGLLIAYEGLRPDLAAKLADTRYIPELITLTLSAISAAFAAICLSRPDQYQIRHVYKFSLSFLMLWAVTAFWGNPDLNWDVMKQAPGLAAYDCVKCIICMSFPPGLAMFWLVRKGTPTKFYWAGAMATLSVTIFAYMGMRLIEPTDNPGHLLLWHAAPVAVMCLIGTLLGRITLRWK